MSADAFLDDLRRELGPDEVLGDPDRTAGYRHDQAAGLPAGTPRAVVRPRRTAEVAAAVRTAAAHRVPVVPRGAGSGLAGGANAIDGCLVVSLERMDRIVRIDPADGTAVVEPGVLNTALRDAAREHGLWYAPDPASRDFCSVGGNVATNAGGLCCVKYGVTRDSVLALEVVLPDGEVTRIGRASVKGVAGYDLTALFTGSEGTLGVVTGITVRLRPLPPPALTVVASFPALPAAAHAVREVLGRSTPSLLELLDRTTLEAVERWRGMGLDTSAEALLIAQTDLPGEAGTAEAVLLERIFADHGASEVARADDPDEADLLLGVRRFAYPALERLGRVYLEDVAVPRGRLADLLTGVGRIAARTGALIGTFGHAGDGNMHPLIVAPHGDPAADDAARDAFRQIMVLAGELGGTITGEHGVGLLKRDGLASELDPAARRIHERIKAALDPLGLMNPGKVLVPGPPTTEGTA
ncbi:FAD-binding oxidoreductase [Pseudonocardia sp. HH130630-07]|uniref:FAD-binding oxidoreductase n=1 Tax=Pseudonocardia sp. HH130630-07 TaxID=1690815 RepID=UPI000814BD15|nr:FAD-linked oxidase C-terminal domain-containing protein [Pseudonocardia sp. HH130630-07]ANY08325.1 FAD-linked oxidase [Pseudonocardia sp. HH130630-07]